MIKGKVMRKKLVSLILVSMLVVGCGSNKETPTVNNDGFQLEENTEGLEGEEQSTKVTATNLLNIFIKDIKKGISADIEETELVGVNVESIKGKVYNTELNITTKGSFRMDSNKSVNIEGYMTHYYTYNTNYADVYKFIHNNKAKDAKSLINKNAKEFAQNVVLYNNISENCYYNIDDNIYKTTSRVCSNDFIISDFSNLKFKELSNGYEVTGTTNNKFLGNVLNFEDIYVGSKTDTTKCKYNFVFTFNESCKLTSITLSLAEGTGSYDTNGLSRVNELYMKNFKVKLSNITYGVEDIVKDITPNIKEKDFLKVVNKY